MIVRLTFFISIIVLSILSLGSFLVTRAYFSDTAVSENISFTTAEEFNNDSSNPEDAQNPPETPDSTSSGKIVINEVSARGGDDKDWVEIYNGTSSVVNLAGWSIEDNDKKDYFSDSEILLPANGYAVVVSDTNTDNIISPIIKIVVPNSIGNGLRPDTDKIILRNKDDVLIDQVSWGSNKTVFDLSPIPENNSLYRLPNGHDTDQASDWKVGVPSLGKANQ